LEPGAEFRLDPGADLACRTRKRRTYPRLQIVFLLGAGASEGVVGSDGKIRWPAARRLNMIAPWMPRDDGRGKVSRNQELYIEALVWL